MPVLDGLDAARALRASEDGDLRLPVLALTGHSGDDARRRCLAAGMDGLVAKPVNGEALMAAIADVLRC